MMEPSDHKDHFEDRDNLTKFVNFEAELPDLLVKYSDLSDVLSNIKMDDDLRDLDVILSENTDPKLSSGTKASECVPSVNQEIAVPLSENSDEKKATTIDIIRATSVHNKTDSPINYDNEPGPSNSVGNATNQQKDIIAVAFEDSFVLASSRDMQMLILPMCIKDMKEWNNEHYYSLIVNLQNNLKEIIFKEDNKMFENVYKCIRENDVCVLFVFQSVQLYIDGYFQENITDGCIILQSGFCEICFEILNPSAVIKHIVHVHKKTNIRIFIGHSTVVHT